MDWWDLPTRLEWALAPDRGAGVTKLGPWLDAWPSGVCVGLGSRTEDLILLGPAAKVRGRVSGVTPWKLSVGGMLALVLL